MASDLLNGFNAGMQMGAPIVQAAMQKKMMARQSKERKEERTIDHLRNQRSRSQDRADANNRLDKTLDARKTEAAAGRLQAKQLAEAANDHRQALHDATIEDAGLGREASDAQENRRLAAAQVKDVLDRAERAKEAERRNKPQILKDVENLGNVMAEREKIGLAFAQTQDPEDKIKLGAKMKALDLVLASHQQAAGVRAANGEAPDGSAFAPYVPDDWQHIAGVYDPNTMTTSQPYKFNRTTGESFTMSGDPFENPGGPPPPQGDGSGDGSGGDPGGDPGSLRSDGTSVPGGDRDYFAEAERRISDAPPDAPRDFTNYGSDLTEFGVPDFGAHTGVDGALPAQPGWEPSALEAWSKSSSSRGTKWPVSAAKAVIGSLFKEAKRSGKGKGRGKAKRKKAPKNPGKMETSSRDRGPTYN